MLFFFSFTIYYLIKLLTQKNEDAKKMIKLLKWTYVEIEMDIKDLN